jgi:hypothetical protein
MEDWCWKFMLRGVGKSGKDNLVIGRKVVKEAREGTIEVDRV